MDEWPPPTAPMVAPAHSGPDYLPAEPMQVQPHPGVYQPVVQSPAPSAAAQGPLSNAPGPSEPGGPPVSSSPAEGRRPHPLSPLVQSWIALLAFVFFVVRDLPEHGLDITHWSATRLLLTAGALFLFAIFGVLGGYFGWRYTRFVLDDQGLRIDRTFINHTSNRVLYTKVQAVDIVQPFAARLIGLAALKVDAGGEQHKIEFLKKSEAEQLRDELMQRAVAARSLQPEGQPEAIQTLPQSGPNQTVPQTGPTETVPTPTGAPQPSWVQPGNSIAPTTSPQVHPQPPAGTLPAATALPSLREPSTLITSSTPQQLVLAAITSAQFVVMLIGVVALGVIPFAVTGEIWGASAVIPAAFGLVGFITSRVINQWNYRLIETISGTLQISRGLTSTVHQSVPKQRIQGFAIRQSRLQRVFGLWEVQISVLGAKAFDSEENTSTLLLPAGTWHQVMLSINAVWPGFDPTALPTQGLGERGRWLRPLTFHSHRWGSDDDVLLHRGGVIVHTIYVVHHARVQTVELSQGPLERRLGLANASAMISSGPVQLIIPLLDGRVAAHLVATELGRAQRARAAEEDKHNQRDSAPRVSPAPGEEPTPQPGQIPPGQIQPGQIPPGQIQPGQIQPGPTPPGDGDPYRYESGEPRP